MTEEERELMTQLEQVAKEKFGGHVTIMRFTTNWRIGWSTPIVCDGWELRYQIDEHMAVGKTFAEAARAALANQTSMLDYPH